MHERDGQSHGPQQWGHGRLSFSKRLAQAAVGNTAQPKRGGGPCRPTTMASQRFAGPDDVYFSFAPTTGQDQVQQVQAEPAFQVDAPLPPTRSEQKRRPVPRHVHSADHRDPAYDPSIDSDDSDQDFDVGLLSWAQPNCACMPCYPGLTNTILRHILHHATPHTTCRRCPLFRQDRVSWCPSTPCFEGGLVHSPTGP